HCVARQQRRPPRGRSRPARPRWPSSSVSSPTTSPRSRRNRPADPSSPADPPNRRASRVRDANAGPAAGAAAVAVAVRVPLAAVKAIAAGRALAATSPPVAGPLRAPVSRPHAGLRILVARALRLVGATAPAPEAPSRSIRRAAESAKARRLALRWTARCRYRALRRRASRLVSSEVCRDSAVTQMREDESDRNADDEDDEQDPVHGLQPARGAGTGSPDEQNE